MPKFELDPRTGMMVQKKDDQIYFAGSMGGGLRIDDKKNNVIYIIERDERITNIAGIRNGQVNLYDLRDARIIADRVLRKFGRDHKYSDYHYFLKGYKVSESIVKTCSEFIGESVFDDIISRSKSGDVRKEVGRYIGDFSDGTRIIAPNEYFSEGELVKFDDKPYYHFEDLNLDVVCFTDGGLDIFYRYDNDSEPGKPNIMKCFETSTELRDDDFDPLIAVAKSENWTNVDSFDDVDVDFRNESVLFNFGGPEYLVFWNENSVKDYALDIEKEFLEDMIFDQKTLKKYYYHYGNDIFNIDSIEEVLKESYENYYSDMNEEEAIDELLKYKIVDDSDEYFEIDEDGDVDQSHPKFDYQDYSDDYVETKMKEIDDPVEELALNFGYSELEYYLEKDNLAKCIVDENGVGSVIAYYDGEERKISLGRTYYVYRQN